MEEREPKITYIRDMTGFPVACLAYSKLDSKQDGKPGIKYAISVHNPADKFDRALAKKIAIGRFKKKPQLFEYDVEDASLSDILWDLMHYFSQDFSQSKRLREAASNYLNHCAQQRTIRALNQLRK